MIYTKIVQEILANNLLKGCDYLWEINLLIKF